MPSVILASGSPRRRLLLPIVCAVVDAVSPGADETPRPGESSTALATRLAETKLEQARQVLSDTSSSHIVSADTVVSLDGQPLGKPITPEEALSMLRSLRGKAHTVITAVSVWDSVNDEICTAYVTTDVDIRELSDIEIERYIDRGEPFDKAGGYAIQDTELQPVRSIRGCFPNVVGLPLCAIESMLDKNRDDGRFVPSETTCALCARASTVLAEHGFLGSLEA